MITQSAVRIRPLPGATTRLLLDQRQEWEGLADYLPRRGYARSPDSAEIRALVEAADLRGRGRWPERNRQPAYQRHQPPHAAGL